MPPEPELMGLDILEDILELIDVLEEVLLDFGALAHSVLDYLWQCDIHEYVSFNIQDISEQCA